MHSTVTFRFRDHRPQRLAVLPDGAQIAAGAGTTVAYAQLMAPPRYGPGQDWLPRSVSLTLMLGTSGKATIDIAALGAWFESEDGVRHAVTEAACGRQQLRGGDRRDQFSYVVTVPR